MHEDILDFLEDYCAAAVLVGSRITCDPPPTDTDQDILVYVPDISQWMELWDVLEDLGWEWEGANYCALPFDSWRKGEYNLILTRYEEWFNNFMTATAQCKKDNILDKAARVAVFDSILKP